jgi:hypothetical protein
MRTPSGASTCGPPPSRWPPPDPFTRSSFTFTRLPLPFNPMTATTKVQSSATAKPEVLDLTALLAAAESKITATQKGPRQFANNGETVEAVPVDSKLAELGELGLSPLVTRKGYQRRYGFTQTAKLPQRKTPGQAAAIVCADLAAKGSLTAAIVHELTVKVSTKEKGYEPSYILDCASRVTGTALILKDDGTIITGKGDKGKRGQTTWELIMETQPMK